MQRLQEESRVLISVLAKTPQLKIFMENPQRPTEHKIELIEKVFKDRLTPMLVTMMRLMILRDRILLLDETLELFDEMVEEAEGIHHAVVQSARELQMQDKLQLKSALEKFTGSRLKIDFQVDPALIGGLIFRYGDTLIDNSISNGLRTIRERLMAAQVMRAGA